MKKSFYLSTAMAALLGGLASPLFAQSTINQSGNLRSGDDELPSGEYYDRYDFEGRAGDVVVAQVASDDFDTYMILRGEGDFSVENDDMDESTTNSRIIETLPADGSYRLLVTSFEAGETGNYAIAAEIGSVNTADQGITTGSLAAGDAKLDDGEFYDVFKFDGRRGQQVSLALASTEFDTYLIIRSPDGEVWQNDDAREGASDSLLTVDLPENGEYTVIVTSFAADETGFYSVGSEDVTLRADRQASNSSSGGGGSSSATTLALDTPVSGRLAPGDEQLGSDEYYDAYTLRGTPGARMVVRMESSDFDTYLGAVGSDDYEIENDDDPSGNNGTNSRLDVTIPSDGQLVIAATSYAGEETGSYTLTASLAAGSSGRAQASGQNINLGQNVSGALSSSDPRGDNSVEDSFVLQASAGQRVRFALSSDDFDTFLRIEGPGGFSSENDDDPSGGTLNSVVETTLPQAGAYRVVVASYSDSGLGSYQLQTSGSAASTSSGSGSATFTLGGQVSGTLASGDDTIPSGEFYDAYSFTGRRGQQVSFDMSSSDFDTYLSLLFPGGGSEENDDRAGGDGDTNSRLTVTLPEDGTYQLVATSYQEGDSGRYSISSSVGASTAVATVDPRNGSSRVFALSVGVADYGGRAGNLSLTDQDATKLTQTLRASGMLANQSVTLINRQATRANFLQAIDEIAANIGPDDLFLLFFSGHGSKQPVEQFMERDGSSETIELFDAAVTDYELAQMIDPIQARILLVLDSCFSGGFDDVINRRTGRMGVFSSDSDLTSLVASKFEAGGYISHILQQAMEGRADANSDNAITAGELSEYMRTTFYRIALSEPLQASTFGSGGSRAQGYQHIVVNRGGDGMAYEEVLLNLGSGGISGEPAGDRQLALLSE